MEVAGTVFPMLGLSDGAGRVVLGLVALGFPVALILGWLFDVGPDGIARTDAQSATPPAASTSRTWALIAVGAAVGAVLVWGIPRILSPSPSTAEVSSIRRLAILPLASLMQAGGESYFVDGMHDAMINELAKVRELTVLSRNSVLRYRDTEMPAARIAEALGVDGLVTGSVYRGGDSVRINVQLVQPDPERTLWAASYEGALGEALGLHRRVAATVAEEVRVSLSAAESSHFAAPLIIDPTAQEAYLRGLAALRTRTVAGIDESVIVLREAVRLAPGFADGWGALAEAERFWARYIGQGHDRAVQDSALGRARVAARRALELDESQPAAMTVLGAEPEDPKDWDAKVAGLRRATEVNPNYAQAWNLLGDGVRATGRLDEALEAHRRAQLLDPLHPVFTRDVAFSLFFQERYAEAESEVRRALELGPDVLFGRTLLFWTLMQQQRFDEVAGEQAQVLTELGADESLVARFVAEYEGGGWSQALLWILELSRDELPDAAGDPALDVLAMPGTRKAQMLAWLGRTDEALDMLELEMGTGRFTLHWLLVKSIPFYRDLRGEERYQRVLRRLNLQ